MAVDPSTTSDQMSVIFGLPYQHSTFRGILQFKNMANKSRFMNPE